MRKKIGIKYCGGCNPTYERVDMIQRVQFRLGDQFLFKRHDEKDVEALILISGCQRACASQDLKQEEDPCYSITEERNFKNLIDWLTTLNEKGDS